MRRTIVTTAVAVVLLAGCKPATRGPSSVSDAREFEATPGKLVSVAVPALDVEVRVAARETIAVEVTLEASSSSPGAAARWVERNRPEFSDGPGRLEISTPKRRRGATVSLGWFRSEGRVTIELPPGCRLEVETTSGDVTVAGEQGLDGVVRLDTASGDITVSGGARELAVDTASGDVAIEGGELVTLQADTASGDVRVKSRVGRAEVETASGDVRLEALTGPLTAETASGELFARWRTPPAEGAARIRTSSGDVHLRFPAGTALRGGVQTTSGHLRSEFDGAWSRHRRSLELSAPEGGFEVRIRTTSGEVVLAKESAGVI
jgi:DUF4097 and DUF4098 domain-containing protein YvlB